MATSFEKFDPNITADSLRKKLMELGFDPQSIVGAAVHPLVLEASTERFSLLIAAWRMGPKSLAAQGRLLNEDGSYVAAEEASSNWLEYKRGGVALPSGEILPARAVIDVLIAYTRNRTIIENCPVKPLYKVSLIHAVVLLSHDVFLNTLPRPKVWQGYFRPPSFITLGVLMFCLFPDVQGLALVPASGVSVFGWASIFWLLWGWVTRYLSGACYDVAHELHLVYDALVDNQMVNTFRWFDWLLLAGSIYFTVYIWVMTLYQVWLFIRSAFTIVVSLLTHVSQWVVYIATFTPIRRVLESFQGVKHDIVIGPMPDDDRYPDSAPLVEAYIREVDTGVDGLGGKPSSVVCIVVETSSEASGFSIIGYGVVLATPKDSNPRAPKYVLATANHVIDTLRESGLEGYVMGKTLAGVPFDFSSPLFMASSATYDLALFAMPEKVMSTAGASAYVACYPSQAVGACSLTRYELSKFTARVAGYEWSSADPMFLKHQIATGPGASGSPIFVNGRVVALHVGGDPMQRLNRAVLLAPLLRRVLGSFALETARPPGLVLESYNDYDSRDRAERIADEYFRAQRMEWGGSADWIPRGREFNEFDDDVSDDYFVPDQDYGDSYEGVMEMESKPILKVPGLSIPKRFPNKPLPPLPQPMQETLFLETKPLKALPEEPAAEEPRPPSKGSKPRQKVQSTESSSKTSPQKVSKKQRQPKASRTTKESAVSRKLPRKQEPPGITSSSRQILKSMASLSQSVYDREAPTEKQLKSLMQTSTELQKALGQLRRQ